VQEKIKERFSVLDVSRSGMACLEQIYEAGVGIRNVEFILSEAEGFGMTPIEIRLHQLESAFDHFYYSPRHVKAALIEAMSFAQRSLYAALNESASGLHPCLHPPFSCA